MEPNKPDEKPAEESSTPATDETAAPSTADEKQPETLADVVEGVFDKATEESSTEEKGAVQKEDKTENDGPKTVEGEEEQAGDDDRKPSFQDHPDWVKMVEERDTLRTENEAVKPLAQRAQAIDSFMADNGLQVADLEKALTIAALMNSDPAKAREALRPYWEACEAYVGAKLPPDLQAEVDEGHLTAARAKELASYRMQGLTAEQRTQHQARTAQAATQREVLQTVASWEQSKAKADPDFVPKKNGEPDGLLEITTMKFMSLCQTERTQITSQRAVALAEQAYADAKKIISRFSPLPPKKKTLSSNGSSSTSVKPKEPANLGELVRQVAASHQSAGRR